MNFLLLRRLTPWIPVLALAGCGDVAREAPPVDAADPLPRDASFAADVSTGIAPDRAIPAPCAATGTGRLRIALGLDPGLTTRAPEVWLKVRCGGGDGSERVLRWDRGATQVVDALAPGAYEVLGSSFVAPWSTSPRVMLADGATAAVSLTLPPAPAALAQLRSESGYAGGQPVWRGTVPFASLGGTASVASLEVDARPYVGSPPSASDAGFLSVTVNAYNRCSTSNACPPYLLRALEIRTRAEAEPTGLAGFAFRDGQRLEPDGDTRSVSQPLVVRGAMPDGAHHIEVVLYGDVMRSEAARP